MKVEPGKNYCANCKWWRSHGIVAVKGDCENEKRNSALYISNSFSNTVTMIGTASPATPENYTCFYHEKH